PWLREGYGNPNSVYALGQKARAAVEKAREQVAALVGASDASEVVFTSGGSESDVLAIAGAAWQAHDESKGARRRVVSTRIEHDAVRLLLTTLRRRGLDAVEAGCGPDGAVRAEELAALVDEATAVVSVMHANNETGVLQPVAEAAAAARARGALAHTDAVQSMGKVGVDAKALGVDLLSLSGHKLNAPKGVGALWVRRGVRLSPVVTGHQEKNRRGGTENVAGIVALGVAAELARRELPAAAAHALALRRRIEAGVLKVAGSRLNGRPDGRLPNTAHFSFEGLDGHHLVVALDLEGVCVSSGPACSSGSSVPSHVLTAMGVDPRLATGSIRVSVGWGVTDADADRFLAVLPKAVEKLRAAGVPA
ncbi:MAG: aminotransferase class V-fold PLP-dependent enzyme, partial [Elusimicrobia bacterium]|nr:aminotransferase class V-fold PLP-dependent enzyme [Elusimicrobiota bacterium]